MTPTTRATMAAMTAVPEAELPSRTYRIDFAAGRISGTTDGIEAVRQAVQKALRTERFAHLIYSWNYGMEWNELIGRSRGVVESELGRLLSEALSMDGRVTGVKDVVVTPLGRSEAAVTVTVETKFGKIREEMTARV